MLPATLHVCVTTSASCSDAGNPLIDTLLPAAIGAALALLATLFIRRGDRQWQLDRERFERGTTIVVPLDDALVECQRRVQGQGVSPADSRWLAAISEWENGWVRLTPRLADAELEARYRAVGTILRELHDQDAQGTLSHGTGVMLAMRAIGNARVALAYWLRDETLPASSFPNSEETNILLGQGGAEPLKADAPLRKWLADHEQAPWRP